MLPGNIGNGAITSAKIGAGAVIASPIKNGVVTTNKLNNGAVTTAKLGNRLGDARQAHRRVRAADGDVEKRSDAARHL